MSRHAIGLLLVAFLDAGVVEDARAQYSSTTLSGVQAPDLYGWAVDFAGDVDQDGVVDVIAGAYTASQLAPFAGYARVNSGATGAVLHTFAGSQQSQAVGSSVAPAYDVDSDGFDDVLVYTGQTVTEFDSVTVFSGRTGLALRVYTGTNGLGGTPRSLASAGDVDGDGFVDAVIGAFYAGPSGGFGPGGAFVYSGASGASLFLAYGDDPGDSFGAAVSGAGDVNLDGFADIIIGADNDSELASNAGSITVFAGPSGGLLHHFDGTFVLQTMGADVDGLGDVDGDGNSDFAAGGVSGGNPGRVWVHSGSSGNLLYTLFGGSTTSFGRALARTGDVDGDGRGDLLVGEGHSKSLGNHSGQFHLYSGASGAKRRTFLSEGPETQLGLSVAAGGDLNGDGRADFLAGAPFTPSAGSGKVHVFESSCQTLYPYGTGCAGTGGFVPKLAVTGCVATGTGSLTLSITQAYGGMTALLFLSATPKFTAQPSTCNLLLGPLSLPIALPLSGVGPGAGSFSATFPVAASQLPLEIHVQAFTLDPKPLGYSATNGFVVGKPGT